MQAKKHQFDRWCFQNGAAMRAIRWVERIFHYHPQSSITNAVMIIIDERNVILLCRDKSLSDFFSSSLFSYLDSRCFRLKMRSNSRLLYVLAASLSVMGTLLVACFVLHRESTQDMSTAFQLGNGAKQTDAGRSMLQQLPPHFSLDTSCARNSSDRVAQERRQEFDQIFDTGYWGKTESRSGEGSSLEGAFDWIKLLRAFFRRFRVQSIADIPCGDTYWQFSLQEINAIEDLYFGGDISMRVIDHNQQRYQSKHYNKLFHYWDLVQCPVPTFTHRNSTHERKGKNLLIDYLSHRQDCILAFK